MKRKDTFHITGMHCVVCAHNVENALSGLHGVFSASVNFAESTVDVEYDDTLVLSNQFYECVKSVGCELLDNTESKPASGKKDYKSTKIRTVIAWVFAVLVFYISVFVGNIQTSREFLAIITLLVLVYCCGRYYLNTFRGIIRGSFSIDTLVALSTGFTYLFSLSGTLFPDFWIKNYSSPPFYFDVALGITAFALLGRLFLCQVKNKSSLSIKKFASLMPVKAKVIMEDGIEIDSPVNSLQRGDKIYVGPNESIAADGTIIEGESLIEERMLGGESSPVLKSVGSKVFAGTINRKNAILVNVEKSGSQTVLAKIIDRLENVQNSESPVGKVAYGIVPAFVCAVLAISLLTYVIWLNVYGMYAFPQAFEAFIAVLAIGCPLAFYLSSRITVKAAIDRGALSNIFFKDAVTIENLAKVNLAVFSDVRALIEDIPYVKEKYLSSQCTKSDLTALYVVGNSKTNPFCKAIGDYAKNLAAEKHDGIDAERIVCEVTDYNSMPDNGIRFVYDEKKYWLGNVIFAKANGVDVDFYKTLLFNFPDDTSVVYFGSDNNLLAAFAIKEKLKDGVKETLMGLRRKGVRVYLLSDNDDKPSQALGHETGVDETIVTATVEEKARLIAQWQKQGNKLTLICDSNYNMSEVGVKPYVRIEMNGAIGSGLDSADVVLPSGNIMYIEKAIGFSREVKSLIKRNLYLTAIYNLIGIIIAAGAFYYLFDIMLSPIIAAAAAFCCIVYVVTNSLSVYKKNI